MKQAFGPRAFAAALLVVFALVGAASAPLAQTASPTPDSFVAQLTSANNQNSFAFGISGNGRFVVIVSEANLTPSDPANPSAGRNNADGNREIFLHDYAQRRTFQITDTRSALVNPANPPVPSGTPNDFSNIEVEVSNNRPFISHDGRYVVFTSNAYADANAAANPGSFNGNSFKDALKADGNQEIFLYRVPDVAEADLSSGAEVPFVDLSAGAFTRVTNTPASFPPTPGALGRTPQAADDNRYPTANDDASIIAFVSTRNLATNNNGTNADLNAEIYFYTRGSGAFSQLTRTTQPNSAVNSVFSTNPSLSADGRTVAFISTADLGAAPAEPAADRGNAEVFIANFNGADFSNLRQVTRTPNNASTGLAVNVFSPGSRRLSRDGNYLAFESFADISATGTASATLQTFRGTYLYNVASNTYALVGPRPTSGGDVFRYPTFTGDSSTIVFTSALNFRPDGSAPAQAADGLNPNNRTQLFAAPVSAPNSFTRVTNVPAPSIAAATPDTQAFVSQTLRRMAFSYPFTEFGGGGQGANDTSYEAFYLLLPAVTSEAAAGSISFFTGASLRPVVAASPAPSPGAEPVTGLAPGMLGVARSTSVALAPAERQIPDNAADELVRRPQLPVELAGVSVAVNNAAAGLYFVGPNQINFVVPFGLAPSATAYNVVVNNNGLVARSTLQINAAQPDILTSANGPGGRAVVFNATDPLALTPEPAEGFPVTTGGAPTKLLIMLTGVRGAAASEITVNIRSVAGAGGKDVTLSGSAIQSVTRSRTHGFDQILVQLPADLAGAGESTVIVNFTRGGATFSSRPADTAPRIRIR